jgi:uncharacterized protein with beta-barrel porin domain
MVFMRCPSRPWWTSGIGTVCAVVQAIAVVVVLVGAASPVHAQTAPPTIPTPRPPPTPPNPTPTMINSTVSAGSVVTNLGSNFLERLGTTNGFSRMLRTNPGGGGASESAEGPRYRTWFDGYGISANNGPLGFFVGDNRKTWGGVAGIGVRVTPGVNIGFSVDQSRTAIDVPLALQSATIDLTQLGFNASVDSGPWTWAMALVHGLGNIDTRRDTGFGFGFASAGYNARLDGAISEISYYWSKDQNRIVPKAAFEYVHARTGSFQEVGGFDPLMVTSSTVERVRLLVGAEVGHYWIIDQKILDLSAYGKFVDNLVQNFSDITVSQGVQSITFQGIGESRYGADAGASASLSITNTVRLYANYDAKFRAALQSHQGTLGLELKW